MKKQDEIDMFNYLIKFKDDHPSLINATRSYNMNDNRKYYILEKWTSVGIWNYGVSAITGWFEDINKFKETK